MSERSNKLNEAKVKKDDEFYTRLCDIEYEMALHKEHFKDKVVYCPCDDYEKSQFVRFFLDHFDEYELKGLIATSYAYANEENRDLFNEEVKRGKILVKTYDDIHYGLLEGDGDFRSKECTSLKEKCDIIATNPPFSLLLEFYSWAKDKELEFVAPLFFITYSTSFNDFMTGHLKMGEALKHFVRPDGSLTNNGTRDRWVSTFALIPKEREMKKRYSPKEYPKYDNFDAIEVNAVKNIPCDYYGVMGVPVTFFCKCDTSQFIVEGKTEKPLLNGKNLFKRIFVRRKKEGLNA